ncbi:putative ribonucleoside triphosphate reductase alphachain [Vibrio phage 501E54-1]|nr:putative ribonucleoside triphosphate reductase alphachain [Vibrio phage 501E54-1]
MTITTIIKSDKTEVPFDPEKLNKKARWGADRKVNWSNVALKALKRLHDRCTSRDIDKALIDVCVEEFDEKHFMLAGRILAGTIYKEAFGGFKKIPTLKEHATNMQNLGYWEELSYREEDWEALQQVIDHSKDLSYSYPEIKQINDKYVIRDRVAERTLESPQFMYMGMAMAVMQRMPIERRLKDVINYYGYLSDKKICAPTPFMSQLRTANRGYASCAIFTTHDTAPSLAAGDHIAYMLTCASAGIGSHIKTRSKGAKVRGGTTVHQGKRPYYKMTESAVAANLQNSRGGSATMHMTCLDPEIMDILTWKNKKTATKIRVDGIHYSFGTNEHFARKVYNNQQWMLVDYSDCPELHEALYEEDQDNFVRLYEEYEKSDKPRIYVDANKLLVESLVQGQESGQVYQHSTDLMNIHTPHKDKIYSSNLCQETGFPSVGYDSVEQLYQENPVNADGSIPEIGLCSLSAIVARRVSPEEWEDVCYYAALAIDEVMDIMDYPFPSLKTTAQARRNIGVGITDLAGHMAERKLAYSSKEGKQYMHRLAELHSYSMIKASVRLAKERGACEWIHKTKWVDGWLPIDTMNKNVYKVVGQELIQDWEGLRKEVLKFGVRNSVMTNYMPNESSSVATNGTNSILPARSLKVIKTNGKKKTRFLAPNADTHGQYYELAYDIPQKDMAEFYAIFQCFTDQSISADEYLDFTRGDISGEDLIKWWMYRRLLGAKTRYYVNSKTNTGSEKKEDNKIEEEEDVGCAGGGCAL